MQAARAMASSGVDLVVLGGVTINLSRGYANADRMLTDLSSDLGVKVTSSAAARTGRWRRWAPRSLDREALSAAWRIQPQ
jgi:hypothetical protein